MRAVDIIHKETKWRFSYFEELSFLIHGYCQGDIPDYQMSAWAMAVFFRGMNARRDC